MAEEVTNQSRVWRNNTKKAEATKLGLLGMRRPRSLFIYQPYIVVFDLLP